MRRLLLTALCALATTTTTAQTPLPTSVEIQVLPETGDPATVTPVAVRETALFATFPPVPPTGYPTAPVINCHLGRLTSVPGAAVINPAEAEVDDPFPQALGRVCRVPMPTAVPAGTYRSAAVFLTSPCPGAIATVAAPRSVCRSARSLLGTTFTVTGTPAPCTPPTVAVEVGEWTRTVPAGGYGRVSYSLLTSELPVTVLVVKFNNVERTLLTGSDLRTVSGSYFAVGETRGTYAFSVEVRDAQGCSDGADRPMTIEVQ